MGILNIPNSLSFSRIFILVPLVYCVLNRHMVLASVLLLVSGFTDVADGVMARRLNQVTRFGTILDTGVDKFHLLVVLVSLSLIGVFPIWATVLMVGREAIIVGAGLDLMRRGQDILPPTIGGRVLGLMLLVMEIFYLVDFSPFTLVLLYAALAVMSISFVNYLGLFLKAIEKGNPTGTAE